MRSFSSDLLVRASERCHSQLKIVSVVDRGDPKSIFAAKNCSEIRFLWEEAINEIALEDRKMQSHGKPK